MLKKKKQMHLIVIALLLISTTAIVYAYTNSDKPPSQQFASEFEDVKDTDWFSSDVQYVKENALMSGTGDDLFSPYDTTTRGMIVTVLWRLENMPNENNCTFTDITDNAYYYNAVCWANKNKIVSGYNEITFGADDFITREQLATIMYRYANYKNYDISAKSSLDKYKDLQDVSDYAISAFEWANANGIISGTSEETLSPKGNALRCQVAAIFKRFCEFYNAVSEEKQNSQSQETEGLTENSKHDHHIISSHSATDKDEDTQINENVPQITIDNITANAGDEVQVKVKVNNNPGVLGMTLSIYFDDNTFDLLSVENGTAFKDVLNLTSANVLESGSNYLWDGIELNDSDIKDGDILLLNFKISDNAADGKYPITIKAIDGDIVDSNLNPIAMQIENGFVNITK